MRAFALASQCTSRKQQQQPQARKPCSRIGVTHVIRFRIKNGREAMAPAKPQTATPTARFLCRTLENMTLTNHNASVALWTGFEPALGPSDEENIRRYRLVRLDHFSCTWHPAWLGHEAPCWCDGSWTSPTTCSSRLPISALALAAQRPCWRLSRGRTAYRPTAG